jgi:hypothetical protein
MYFAKQVRPGKRSRRAQKLRKSVASAALAPAVIVIHVAAVKRERSAAGSAVRSAAGSIAAVAVANRKIAHRIEHRSLT